MVGIEAKDRWVAAQQAFSIFDTIRPNPNHILSETIQLEYGYRKPFCEYFGAQTAEGSKYCFVDWVAEEDRVMNYYYGYRSGNGLVFQPELQKELDRRGFTAKLRQLEKDHDGRKGKPPLTDDDFLSFLTENNVLVPGPLPPPIETIVKGEGIALWMPEDLFRLTSLYGWVNQQDK
jgi:hypothetical protein